MLYESIMRLCKQNNITVATLERKLQLSNATIRRWKDRSPTVANVVKVAQYFGVTVDDLIHGTVGKD